MSGFGVKLCLPPWGPGAVRWSGCTDIKKKRKKIRTNKDNKKKKIKTKKK
jgi:hypothetical protein